MGRSKPPQFLGLLWSLQLDRVVPGVNLLGDVEITVADLEGWEGVSPHGSWACSGRLQLDRVVPGVNLLGQVKVGNGVSLL